MDKIIEFLLKILVITIGLISFAFFQLLNVLFTKYALLALVFLRIYEDRIDAKEPCEGILCNIVGFLMLIWYMPTLVIMSFVAFSTLFAGYLADFGDVEYKDIFTEPELLENLIYAVAFGIAAPIYEFKLKPMGEKLFP